LYVEEGREAETFVPIALITIFEEGREAETFVPIALITIFDQTGQLVLPLLYQSTSPVERE
jgi:hypothetical protein